MSDHSKEEKEKKRKKRIADVLFHMHAARFVKNVDIGTPDTRKDKPAAKRSEGIVHDEECAEKLATVYKSLELRRREAKDRWNRFAGTSGGGGRGR